MDDHVEIRSSGEVNALELIDEIYSDGIVTVSIRADIFSQESKCSAADYTKRIASTYYPIRFPAQAADGQIHDLGEAVARRMQQSFSQITPDLAISHLEPYVLDWGNINNKYQAQKLAEKSDAQYALAIEIKDIGVEREFKNAFNFYKNKSSVRNFAYQLSLLNGADGETLYSRFYEVADEWQYDYTETVDVHSRAFWQSKYGIAINKSLQKAITDLEEAVGCEPTMGRILAVNQNQVQINLGANQNVQAGDKLVLFSVTEITDSFGQRYEQFNLHPTELVVQNVFADTSTLVAADGSLLGNIQANDYVARQ